MPGPLTGLRVLEMAGIGPGPFCAMMLADMGAEVVRVDRLAAGFLGGGGSIIDRGRRSLAMDLKKPGATDIILRLIETSDVVLEGFRPGVMERLGLGPAICLARNPRIVYARATGWGQSGPLSSCAGHDLNYLAITGALHAMGYDDRPPTPPLHLLGDISGGAMLLAFGIVCALREAKESGQGQIVDGAICDGVSLLATAYHGWRANGKWADRRHSNMLDGGAHFYACYECEDGKFISVGAIEPQFYEQFLTLCGIDDPEFSQQWDRRKWPALRQRLVAFFKTRTRDQWCEIFQGSDACVAPVLEFSEAAAHEHNRARNSFVETDGIVHPAPAPRLSRTPARPGSIASAGQHTHELLLELGFSDSEIEGLRFDGTVN